MPQATLPKPWKKGDPIDAARLQSMQERPVYEIQVTHPLKMIRNGNNVAISLGELPVRESCTTDSPDTVGASTEGSEAADTVLWSAEDDKTPVDVWVTSRVAYYHAGDEKLYGYARKLTFNSCGKLVEVSGETRYEIDVPEDCP